jgi:hypothetical protein
MLKNKMGDCFTNKTEKNGPFVPNLGSINTDLGSIQISTSNKYHIRKLQGVACWAANTHLHDDKAFKIACLGHGGVDLRFDIHHHIEELVRGEDLTPDVVYRMIKDFERYVGIE